MILAPRGECIEAKAPGGEQTQGVPKAKGRTRSLSEHLVGFAELFRSLSADSLPKLIEGKRQGGEAPLVRGTNPFPPTTHTKERLSTQSTSGIPIVLANQKLNSYEGSPSRDSAKARSLRLDNSPIEKSQIKPSFLFQGNGRGKETSLKESVLNEMADKETAVKGELKGQKPSVGWMEKQSGKVTTRKDLTITMSDSTDDRKNPVSHRNGIDVKNPGRVKDLETEKTRDRVSVQGKGRTEAFEKARAVQTVLSEGKSSQEGEKAKIEPSLPTLDLRVDLSGDYRKILDQGNTTTGSISIARETVLHQLQEKANPEIVHQAQLFLKNEEDGEIRLILKPEQLGEVRIRLHLQDRLIEGHITVENSIVKDLFEQNMGELSQAFREQGFEMSQLEVSVGRDPQHREAEQETTPSQYLKTTRIAEQIPSIDRGWMDIHRLVDYYA